MKIKRGEHLKPLDDKCRKCGSDLPEPDLESTGPGYSELVTECPECGEIYYD